MRTIPDILKNYIGKDANGEYLQLMDRNGHTTRISVVNNNFQIDQQPVPSRGGVSVGNSTSPPEIHFDCRDLNSFPGGHYNMEYHLRRKPIPGETFVLLTSILSNFFQVISERAYISISISDAMGIGYPNTSGGIFNNEKNVLYWEIFTNVFEEGRVITANENAPYWKSWARLVKKSIEQVENASVISGGQESGSGYVLEVEIDVEKLYDEFPNGAPNDLNDHTLRLILQDVLDPESMIYMNVCLDPNNWPALPEPEEE
jgi:hypothetical protein